MGQLGLKLITGPANAGKVALLLRRYLEALDDEPYLIVPNRSDVERVERDLLELQPALLAGSIGTFDDLFTRIARRGGGLRQVATDARRAHRGHGVDSVRARTARVRVADPHHGRPRKARRRPHRGAGAEVRRDRGAGTRPSRADALLGAASVRRAAARRRASLLRGCR